MEDDFIFKFSQTIYKAKTYLRLNNNNTFPLPSTYYASEIMLTTAYYLIFIT